MVANVPDLSICPNCGLNAWPAFRHRNALACFEAAKTELRAAQAELNEARRQLAALENKKGGRPKAGG